MTIRAQIPAAVRDPQHERELLDRAGVGDRRFIGHALARLDAGETEFGQRWTTLTLEEFLRELSEEAADLGAWAVLAEQRFVQHRNDAQPHVKAALHEAARAGARAHRAIDALSLILQRLDEEPRAHA